MQIIKGGKPEPEDTFPKDMLLTHTEVDTMLIRKQITRAQYDKLIKEINIDAGNN